MSQILTLLNLGRDRGVVYPPPGNRFLGLRDVAAGHGLIPLSSGGSDPVAITRSRISHKTISCIGNGDTKWLDPELSRVDWLRDFSVSWWIKKLAPLTTTSAIHATENGTGPRATCFNRGDGLTVSGRLRGNSSPSSWNANIIIWPPVPDWQHVVYAVKTNPLTVTVYHNGEIVSIGNPTAGAFDSTERFVVAGREGTQNAIHNIGLDDFQLYGRELSQREVFDLYKAGGGIKRESIYIPRPPAPVIERKILSVPKNPDTSDQRRGLVVQLQPEREWIPGQHGMGGAHNRAGYGRAEFVGTRTTSVNRSPYCDKIGKRGYTLNANPGSNDDNIAQRFDIWEQSLADPEIVILCAWWRQSSANYGSGPYPLTLGREKQSGNYYHVNATNSGFGWRMWGGFVGAELSWALINDQGWRHIGFVHDRRSGDASVYLDGEKIQDSGNQTPNWMNGSVIYAAIGDWIAEETLQWIEQADVRVYYGREPEPLLRSIASNPRALFDKQPLYVPIGEAPTPGPGTGEADDAMTITDSATATWRGKGEASDAMTITDSESVVGVFIGTAVDVISATDAAFADTGVDGLALDAMTIADTSTGRADFGAPAVDAMTISDTASVIWQTKGEAADSITASDAAFADTGLEGVAADSMLISDSASAIAQFQATAADAMTAADNSSGDIIGASLAADAMTIADASVATWSATAIAADGMTITDASLAIFEGQIIGFAIDTITIADGAIGTIRGAAVKLSTRPIPLRTSVNGTIKMRSSVNLVLELKDQS